jgi:hypothetical protein
LILPKNRLSNSVGKSSSNLQGTRLLEELEQLYREMEQREKDYAVAVEIGKMLLDKNKELQDQNTEMQGQIELLVYFFTYIRFNSCLHRALIVEQNIKESKMKMYN